MSKQTKGWAVVTPFGEVLIHTVRRFRHEARAAANLPINWLQAYPKGYRCVRVTINPEKEAGNGATTQKD